MCGITKKQAADAVIEYEQIGEQLRRLKWETDERRRWLSTLSQQIAESVEQLEKIRADLDKCPF